MRAYPKVTTSSSSGMMDGGGVSRGEYGVHATEIQRRKQQSLLFCQLSDVGDHAVDIIVT